MRVQPGRRNGTLAALACGALALGACARDGDVDRARQSWELGTSTPTNANVVSGSVAVASIVEARCTREAA